MRLIDADKLKECAIACNTHNGTLTDLCVPLYQIDNAPTVNPTYPLPEDVFLKITDAEWEHSDNVCITTPSGKKIELEKKRPHGKWIKQEWGYVCSVCGESNDYAYDNNIHKFIDNFCPNCGAKMDGGEEE